ncbi:MAG TPA: D-erythronate dehydrogenase [Alphaproteobacteria bacterium]|nr:D-erythronate dehydrogenase [Alphaproteobacteria bacterium]
MRILITGGNGFLGRKLAGRLLNPAGQDARKAGPAVDELVLLDVQPGSEAPEGATVMTGDLCDNAVQRQLRAQAFDSVFHLAAVVSAAAEADFDLGMRVNLEGTRALLEVCRSYERAPRFVFASSIAAFGHAPPVVEDDTPARPQSSYGSQKAIGELLVNDYSRKGFVEGCSVRLPTVVVRPGRPNAAASSFASSILREPLMGERAVCPVPLEQGLWIASPKAVVENLVHAHDVDPAAWHDDHTLNLPGITVRVSEMLEALERAGGDRGLIEHVPDERIARLVRTWPAVIRTARADAMGFHCDSGIDAIIRAYIDEDMPPRQPSRTVGASTA